MHKYCLALILPLLLLAGAGDLHAQGKEKGKKGKGKPVASQHTPEKAKVDYLFIEANTQHLQGNRAEAIALYKEVVEIDPNNHAALYNIGRLYAELGDHGNARRYCEQALSKEKEIYWYYTELVSAYERGYMNAEALKTQEALVAKFPKEKNALYDLAQMYISGKRYQDALETYTRLEALTGMNEEIAFRKHQLFMFLNQPDKSLAELERLVKANPGESRYQQARYDILVMTGRQDEAMKVLEDLLQANPHDSFALFALADYYKAKGDMARSDSYLFRAFSSKSVDIEAKAKIMAGLYQLADRDKALLPRIAKLSDLLWAAHPGEALSAGIRGDVFQANDQPDSARYYYRLSLAKEPANATVWQELLLIDSEQDDAKALQADAEKALEYFPNQHTFLYFFGLGCERNGSDDEAIYAYEKLKKVASNDREMKLQALLSLGSLYHKTEQYTKSSESFEQALQVDPENALILNNYAYYLSLRNERLEDAERMAMRALDKQPNSPSVQDTYGWILYLKGDLGGAKQWISKSAENGGGAEVLEHLGDVYHKLGDIDRAKENWQKALDAGATNFSLSDKLKQQP